MGAYRDNSRDNFSRILEQGPLADPLVVDGDPLSNIELIENPGKALVAIVKDGKV